MALEVPKVALKFKSRMSIFFVVILATLTLATYESINEKSFSIYIENSRCFQHLALCAGFVFARQGSTQVILACSSTKKKIQPSCQDTVPPVRLQPQGSTKQMQARKYYTMLFLAHTNHFNTSNMAQTKQVQPFLY